jgi:hydrogenase/urease accessory protein HupE
MFMKKLLALFVAIASVSGAWAHPGHGHGNPLSPGHYVTTPEHVLPLALTIAVGIILANWFVAKRLNKSEKK